MHFGDDGRVYILLTGPFQFSMDGGTIDWLGTLAQHLACLAPCLSR